MRKFKIQFKNLFIIIFVSYIIVLVIPLAMTAAVYIKSEKVVQEKISDSNFAMLRQIQNTVDARINEIDKLSNQILVNRNTAKIMYTNGILNANKRLAMVDMIKDFSSYKNISPFIDDFFVYFHNINYIITATSSCMPEFYFDSFIDSDQSYEQWMYHTLNKVHAGSFIRMDIKSLDGKSRSELVFLKSLPGNADSVPLGNIFIQVDYDKFKNLLASVDDIDGGMAYVLDRDSKIFFHSAKASDIFPADASAFTGNKGEFEKVINKTEYVFTYKVSAQSGLTYITAFPKNILQAEVEYMRRFTWIALYICIVIALVLISFMTYKYYKPIQNIAGRFGQFDADTGESNIFRYIENAVQSITNKNKQFSEEMDRHLPLFRSAFLLKLINGSAMDPAELSEAAESYGIRFQHENFVTILMHVEDCSRFVKDNSENERNYVKLILNNISEELANSIGSGCTVETDTDTMCLILNLPSMDENESHKVISEMAERIKREVENYFMIILSIGVGKVVKGTPAIHSSYVDALHALEYRLIRGVSSIIYADEIKHSSLYYHYPTETENHIMNLVKSGDYSQVESIINELFEENFKKRRLSVSIGKCLIFDISSTAIKILDMVNANYSEIFGETGPVDKLLQCKTVYHSKDMLLSIFRKLCNNINNNKRSHNDQLKTAILEYINQTYGDEKLCQTMIADHFNISPNYLSNFFHEQVGEKMSSYISTIRIQKTKELLLNTDFSISQIAEKVGFGSDLSLIRVFKKIEGLTPGQYRSHSEKREMH